MPVARPPRPTRSIRSGDRQHWWVLDAADQTLGRLAARVASLLRGKENILFTPHADAGDFVVIVNAERSVRSLPCWLRAHPEQSAPSTKACWSYTCTFAGSRPEPVGTTASVRKA